MLRGIVKITGYGKQEATSSGFYYFNKSSSNEKENFSAFDSFHDTSELLSENR